MDKNVLELLKSGDMESLWYYGVLDLYLIKVAYDNGFITWDDYVIWSSELKGR